MEENDPKAFCTDTIPMEFLIVDGTTSFTTEDVHKKWIREFSKTYTSLMAIFDDILSLKQEIVNVDPGSDLNIHNFELINDELSKYIDLD